MTPYRVIFESPLELSAQGERWAGPPGRGVPAARFPSLENGGSVICPGKTLRELSGIPCVRRPGGHQAPSGAQLNCSHFLPSPQGMVLSALHQSCWGFYNSGFSVEKTWGLSSIVLCPGEMGTGVEEKECTPPAFLHTSISFPHCPGREDAVWRYHRQTQPHSRG